MIASTLWRTVGLGILASSIAAACSDSPNVQIIRGNNPGDGGSGATATGPNSDGGMDGDVGGSTAMQPMEDGGAPDAGGAQDPGSMPGAAGAGGAETSGLEVSISAPTGKTYTNGTIEVQIFVSGGDQDTLQLLVDKKVFASVAANGKYSWDTTGTPEGTHAIVARATLAGKTYDSAEQTVVVDRTPPKLTARVPAPSDANVFVDDAITAVFSEALSETSVAVGSVTMTANNAALSCAPALSADGKTITITPQGTVPVPGALSATLTTTLKDLAGNALAAPATWSWQVPNWVWMGGKAINAVGNQSIPSTCVLGPSHETNEPVLAYTESDGMHVNAYVHQWSGSAWKQLGGGLQGVTNQDVISTTMLGKNGDGPLILLESSDGQKTNAYVQQWNGTKWVPLGGALNPSATSLGASVFIEGYGQSGAFVALLASDGTYLNVYVYSWSGTAWNLLGKPINATAGQSAVARPVLRLNSAGQPLVAFDESDGTVVNGYVYQWNGSAWLPVGGAINAVAGQSFAGNPQLAITSVGRPTFVSQESDGVLSNYYVMQWSGSAWTQRGPLLNPVAGQSPGANSKSFALTSADVPVMMFRELNAAATATDVWVQKLVGASWQTIGQTFNPVPGQTPGNSNMTLDPKDRPIVSVTESDGNYANCYAYRANKP